MMCKVLLCVEVCLLAAVIDYSRSFFCSLSKDSPKNAVVLQDYHSILSSHNNHISETPGLVAKWCQKEKIKTSSVALVVCLNIGVDPPGVMKVSPCAKKQCWIDPSGPSTQKALEAIGVTMQSAALEQEFVATIEDALLFLCLQA